ncbi:MAG TPA: di-heme oxidoredictase family protein [Sandaracinaceae bacterium]
MTNSARRNVAARGRWPLSLAMLAIAAACESAPEPRVCPPFQPNTPDALSLEAAREAHRFASLRRALRLEEARAPGYVMRLTAARTAGEPCFAELYVAGRILFEHEFGYADGLGNELSPTRRRNPFVRVHAGRFGGPDTNGCRSCHWRGGPAGAGDLPDAALFFGDGDRTSSADARNPPSLAGVGVIELVAAQLSADLAAIRDGAIDRARRDGRPVEASLLVSGIDFGVVRAMPDGGVDTSGVRGVDPDLVVRPFGWKGTFATLRAVVDNAFQVHMGIQSEELVARGDAEVSGGEGDDPDRDGAVNELTSGQLDAVVAFLAAQAIPIYRPHETVSELGPRAPGFFAPLASVYVEEWTRGRALFDELGCATCHVPSIVLRDPRFTSGAVSIDLSRDAEHPRIAYDESVGGYPVFLFSDLRRHDLGQENASRHVDAGVPREQWLTRPLWGLADSGPWMHDGTATRLDEAIERHGGEAAESREAFRALDYQRKGDLRVYLMSLRRQWRPTVL